MQVQGRTVVHMSSVHYYTTAVTAWLYLMNFLQTHGQIFNLNFTCAPKYSTLFMISVSKCFLCNSGDAQFVSATYRLFKVPQDSKTDGSRVTYKGIGYNLNKRVKKWEKREGEKERNISPYPHRTPPHFCVFWPPTPPPFSILWLSIIPLLTLRLLQTRDRNEGSLTAR